MINSPPGPPAHARSGLADGATRICAAACRSLVCSSASSEHVLVYNIAQTATLDIPGRGGSRARGVIRSSVPSFEPRRGPPCGNSPLPSRSWNWGTQDRVQHTGVAHGAIDLELGAVTAGAGHLDVDDRRGATRRSLA